MDSIVKFQVSKFKFQVQILRFLVADLIRFRVSHRTAHHVSYSLQDLAPSGRAQLAREGATMATRAAVCQWLRKKCMIYTYFLHVFFDIRLSVIFTDRHQNKMTEIVQKRIIVH